MLPFFSLNIHSVPSLVLVSWCLPCSTHPEETEISRVLLSHPKKVHASFSPRWQKGCSITDCAIVAFYRVMESARVSKDFYCSCCWFFLVSHAVIGQVLGWKPWGSSDCKQTKDLALWCPGVKSHELNLQNSSWGIPQAQCPHIGLIFSDF